jgi:hypothetical protein
VQFSPQNPPKQPAQNEDQKLIARKLGLGGTRDALSGTQTSRERASGNAERHRWPEMPAAGLRSPHAVHADGRGDRLPDLPGAGFIGALQWRCGERVGPGGADAEGDKARTASRASLRRGAVTSRRGFADPAAGW